ncbi:PolC-type DNA polymerase III [Algoriphagus namhaensis]|uniref:PolC-type DNA polymerase III n=1 Tax=Algoriphagus namhaensis TaxID=915353 RepID=A0ABV8APM4_9BACT
MIWPFGSKKKIPETDFVKRYLDENSRKIPGIRQLDLLEFVVFDTETTGLNPKEDFILSFGAVKIQERKILVNTAVEWYPNSPKAGSQTAEIHGLLRPEATLEIQSFIKQVLAYFSNSILVGHHVGFDLQMLHKASKAYGLPRLVNPTLDTMNLAIRLDYGPSPDRQMVPMKEYGLDTLCDRFGIATEDRHTAPGDAFLTAQLLLKLLKLAEQKGINTFSDLLR